MLDADGVNWLWVLQFLGLLMLVTVVTGFVVIVINSMAYTVIQRWKKGKK